MSGHRTARVLIYSHRWLGIALGLLFIVWFLSGIVMMYARMPALDPNERLARLVAVNAASLRVAPPAEMTDGAARLTVATLEGRPVYRSSRPGGMGVFADTGDPVPPVDAEQALRIARAFAGGHVGVHYDGRLLDADQWTFGVRGRMPLHRLAVDDGKGTRLYVTENGGEVVVKTTASGRRWGAAGAVMHWLYFAPFRRHASLWSNTIIGLSLAGTVLSAIGIGWGVSRFRPVRGYRLRVGRRFSPYTRWMRWHHYAGLIFGVTTMMWVFSGMLSMDPWRWSPGTAPTPEQRERVAGGSFASGELSLDRVRRAIAAFAPGLPREISFIRFRGHAYAVAAEGVVSLDAPHLGASEQLPPDLVVGAAHVAMPGAEIEGMHWMDAYDAYYYDRDRRLSLPVLRVRYADRARTWLYIDPRRGTIARKEERLSRINRWLYHGFHSLDFPFLYYRRPLWDIVVIALSVGGLIVSASPLAQAWRRLRRGVRRLRFRYSSGGFRP